jgi:hypothetical protein
MESEFGQPKEKYVKPVKNPDQLVQNNPTGRTIIFGTWKRGETTYFLDYSLKRSQDTYYLKFTLEVMGQSAS